MEKELYIVGEYISGIKKRPDLVNQPCALIYREEVLTLSVLVNEEAEIFDFPYSSINNISSSTRVLVSENMGLNNKDPRTYEHLIAFAIRGFKGYTVSKMSEISEQAFHNTIGRMDYSHMFELIVEYNSPEGIRRLLLNTFNNPKPFIKYFDNIKK